MKAFIVRLIARLLRRGNHHGQEHAGAGMASMAGMAGMAGMADMLDCDAVMRQLWDYLDGELTADRRSAIRAHLELCRRCYPQYEFERAFLDAIAASAPAHSNPDRLRARLLAALKDEGLGA